MAKRKVIWTRTADIQFVGILEYWVNRNKSVASLGNYKCHGTDIIITAFWDNRQNPKKLLKILENKKLTLPNNG